MNNNGKTNNRTITLLNVSITQVFPCITNMIVHPLNEHIVSLKSSEVKLMQDINQDKKERDCCLTNFYFKCLSFVLREIMRIPNEKNFFTLV